MADKYVFSKEIRFRLTEKQGSNYDEWGDAMYAGLRDAFIGVYNFQNGAYNDAANIEGKWYEMTVPTNSYMIIGELNTAVVTLAQISPSSEYTQWNTRGFYINCNLDEYPLTDVILNINLFR